jgi:heme-degrading monooxygenase HmoA
MFSVIFEVLPGQGRKDEYLEHAKQLKPILETMDGFIDNERFESRLRPGWILSHSTWRDEKSLVRWRTQGEHHAVQEKGRFELFSDYHLRVGELTFDSNPPQQAPTLEQRFDETETGIAKVATLTELTPQKGAPFVAVVDLLLARLGLVSNDDAVVEHDIFESIYSPGELALLVGWKVAQAANSWSPRGDGVEKLRHRRIRIVRDYGRFDRREAPQFYPDIDGARTRHGAGR